MRQPRRFAASLALLFALGFGPLAAIAETLVLRDGAVVPTKGPWKADQTVVHYVDLDGRPMSLALELVDLDASRDRSAPGKAILASRVTLYATSWCGYCRKTRELLKSLNVPYIEKDIEKDAAGYAEYAKKARPGSGVPVLDMAGTVIHGYQEARIRDVAQTKGLIAPQ